LNLNFQFFANVERDGRPCVVERADVTKCGKFWQLWRSPAADNVKKLLYVRNENGVWYAYRYKVAGTEVYEPFNLTYQLKDVTKLLPYQPVAVSYIVQSIINNGSAADGSDTGIGKTYHALAACRELSLKPCIICRKAGMPGWKRACKYMNIIPFMIANWEMVRTAKICINNKPVVLRKKREFRAGYDYTWNLPAGILLIFDEAHLGFNDESQNNALWTASSGRASLQLSATFADRPARLKGLFQVLRIMEPQVFDKWLLDRGHFVNQYAEVESLDALNDMKAINKILYPKHGWRVSYEDAEVKKFFPERVIQTEVVDLGEKIVVEQNKLYDEMIAKAAHFKELGKQAELMVAELRYRQSAELMKVKVLAEMAQEYLYEGMCAIVFVNFRETLRYLAEILKTRSMIFGDQERFGVNREETIQDFQDGQSKLLLCMSNAGGQSISLHDINGTGRRISLICPTYDPIVLQQVLGRTHRAGSKSTPIMKLVYAAGTVEEKVAESVNKKLDNIAALNNGDLMEPDLFSLGIDATKGEL